MVGSSEHDMGKDQDWLKNERKDADSCFLRSQKESWRWNQSHPLLVSTMGVPIQRLWTPLLGFSPDLGFVLLL